MFCAVLCISMAFALYSIAIFSERFKKRLRTWMAIVFVLAFLFDLTGTWAMSQQSKEICYNTHTLFGFLALGVMAAHLTFCIVAIKKGGETQRVFGRYSLIAWGVWVLALYSGMPKL